MTEELVPQEREIILAPGVVLTKTGALIDENVSLEHWAAALRMTEAVANATMWALGDLLLHARLGRHDEKAREVVGQRGGDALGVHAKRQVVDHFDGVHVLGVKGHRHRAGRRGARRARGGHGNAERRRDRLRPAQVPRRGRCRADRRTTTGYATLFWVFLPFFCIPPSA